MGRAESTLQVFFLLACPYPMSGDVPMPCDKTHVCNVSFQKKRMPAGACFVQKCRAWNVNPDELWQSVPPHQLGRVPTVYVEKTYRAPLGITYALSRYRRNHGRCDGDALISRKAHTTIETKEAQPHDSGGLCHEDNRSVAASLCAACSGSCFMLRPDINVDQFSWMFNINAPAPRGAAADRSAALDIDAAPAVSCVFTKNLKTAGKSRRESPPYRRPARFIAAASSSKWLRRRS